MNVWMKGQEGREVFSVKSPATKSFKGASGGLPYDVNKSPLQTLVVRQDGEAWTKPFAAVFEPSTTDAPASIRQITSFNAAGASAGFVGLKIESNSGRTDYIFSSDDISKTAVYNELSAKGTYSVIKNEGRDFTLFMGNGTLVSNRMFSIQSATPTTAALEYYNGIFSLTSDAPVEITTPETYKELTITENGKAVTYKAKSLNGKSLFEIGVANYGTVVLK